MEQLPVAGTDVVGVVVLAEVDAVETVVDLDVVAVDVVELVVDVVDFVEVVVGIVVDVVVTGIVVATVVGLVEVDVELVVVLVLVVVFFDPVAIVELLVEIEVVGTVVLTVVDVDRTVVVFPVQDLSYCVEWYQCTQCPPSQLAYASGAATAVKMKITAIMLRSLLFGSFSLFGISHSCSN